MNYRVSVFMYLYLRHRRNYPQRQARSPILDQWQMEPQWQAILSLQVSDLDLIPDSDGDSP